MSEIKFFTHPTFPASKAIWKKLDDFYEGDQEVMKNTYLWEHEFEADTQGIELKKVRWQRTTYDNQIKPYVTRLVNTALSAGITLSDDAQELFKPYEQNVDGEKSTIEQFIRMVAANYFLFGKPIIITDSNSAELVTKQDDDKVRPFFELIDPLSFMDWQTDDKKQLIAGRYEYDLLNERTSLMEQGKKTKHTKVYMLIDGHPVIQVYKMTDKKWEPAGPPVSLMHFDELPIAITETESWINCAIPTAQQLYNQQSAMDNQLNFQGQQRIIAIGKFTAGKNGTSAPLNEGNLLLIDGESGSINVVQPTDPVALDRNIDKLKAQIAANILLQDRMIARDSKEVASAESQDAMKDNLHESLKEAIGDIESVMNHAIGHFNTFEGKQVADPRVTISKELSKESLDDLVKLVTIARDRINRSAEWQRQIDKRLVSEMGLEEVEKILKEIDSAPTEVQTQRSLGLSRLVADGREDTTQA